MPTIRQVREFRRFGWARYPPPRDADSAHNDTRLVQRSTTALQGRFGTRGPAGSPASSCGDARRRRRARAVRLRRPHASPPASAPPSAARSSPRATRSSAARAPARRARTRRPARRATDNNDFDMGYVDVDSDSYDVQLEPRDAGAPVRVDRPLRGPLLGRRHLRRRRRLGRAARRGPRRSSSCGRRRRRATGTITASVLDTDALSATRYQGFADVTSQVAAGRQRRLHGREHRDRHRQGPLRRLGARRRRTATPPSPCRRLLVYDGLLALQSGLRTYGRHLALRFRHAAVRHRRRPPRHPRRGRATRASPATRRRSPAARSPTRSTRSPTSSTRRSRAPARRRPAGRRATSTSSASTRTSSRSTATSPTTCRARPSTSTTATDLYLPGAMALAFDEGPPFASALRRISAAPPATARR